MSFFSNVSWDHLTIDSVPVISLLTSRPKGGSVFAFSYTHCGAQGEERSSVVLPRTSHLGGRLWAGVSVGWGGVGTSSFVFLAQW